MTFEEFVAARLGALLRYATALTFDPHHADDIVSEVLVRASTRWRRITRMDQPEAYVKRMIVNEFISARRRSAKVVPMSHEQLDSAAAAVDPHAGLPERDALMRQVSALPRRQRAVIALRYFEGHSFDEIAEILGVRPSTVRVHASQALARLRMDVTTVGENR
ncbi:RNA polymerase sigma-70 factor (sigma-E family) [Actinoplanes lutulentus]|uniref:RNA polymerase sigma-70 factor (Sigma-E family) n=1 Tax=Actinoplanes lutulentus TaxID=1287878 RepID=A0A327ZKN6_9ACTN|nr:SigE family RNA polymerase sigma factor [Actinoplanes lutulentus]MBB2941198.1 RNA polymerase sigma-70 factor (sigma-E family) [Actinoplanes lutulentus]RAK43507.1 RNA polymerase sigma-70 factor (sigma-E family) [Actinoplanes lutulentus]